MRPGGAAARPAPRGPRAAPQTPSLCATPASQRKTQPPEDSPSPRPSRRAPGPVSPRAPPRTAGISGTRTTPRGSSGPACWQLSLRSPEPLRVTLPRPRRASPAPSTPRPPHPGPRARAAGAPGRPAAAHAGPSRRPVLVAPRSPERPQLDDAELEAAALDEALRRRCRDWLRGVEAAAARPGRALDSLPHLSSP